MQHMLNDVNGIFLLTLANKYILSSSSLSSQNDANNVSSCLEGGVVKSKNRVSNVFNEHAGNF